MSADHQLLPIDVKDVMASPSTSFWLKQAIQDNLNRDPVDALNDVEVLMAVLQNQLQGLLG